MSNPHDERTTLDHTSYPHLLDAILACADRPTLLTLRLVSHSLRDLADRQLAHHLIITSSSRPGAPGPVTSRAGRLPVLRRARLTAPSLLAARVVDIVGDVRAYPRHPVLARLNARGGVHTARMRHAPGGSLAAACVLNVKEVVVFTTITERQAGAPATAHAGEGATSASPKRPAPAAADMCALPSVSRVVLNVRYDPNRPWLAQAVIGDSGSNPGGGGSADLTLPPSCAQLVLLLTEKATHREPQIGGGQWPAVRAGGMLSSVVELAARPRRGALDVVLVGVERLRPEWLGMPDLSGTEVQALLVAEVERRAVELAYEGRS